MDTSDSMSLASFESETRVVDLTESTINANSVHFDHIDDVPKQAVSMGLNSIMRAKRIILLAFGERKRDAIHQLLNGETNESLLHLSCINILM